MSMFLNRASLAADAANTISRFVSFQQVYGLDDLRSTLLHPTASSNSSGAAVVVLCASAILPASDIVMSSVIEVAKTTDEPIVLVLCGGIGHSTQLMHEAVQQHPQYRQIADEVRGKPEARILQAIAEKFFQLQTHDSNGVQEKGLIVLVEDASTNCALNAVKSKEILDSHGFTSPRSIVVSQDPTMCRRTVAAFEKIYATDKPDNAPVLSSWPAFVPEVAALQANTGDEEDEDEILKNLTFTVPGTDDGLWSMHRFMSLLVGEIPRMRDDENGYGPRGKGSIVHVEIPQTVEDAWRILSMLLGFSER